MTEKFQELESNLNIIFEQEKILFASINMEKILTKRGKRILLKSVALYHPYLFLRSFVPWVLSNLKKHSRKKKFLLLYRYGMFREYILFYR